MTVTVLIVGYGAFGALHAAAWRTLPGIALRVADGEAAARERALRDGMAPDAVFADWADAMTGADIVDIVTPPDTHVGIAEAALRAGRAVLVEKPAARNRADAMHLAAAAGSRPVQVNLILRAHPLTMRARRMLAEGAVGRLLTMCGDFSGWKRMRADSSLIENDGVHFLDLMRHLAGAPVIGVDAVAHAHLGGPRADDIRIDTRHGNDVRGELRLGLIRGGIAADSVVAGAATRKELLLCGDGGILQLDFNRNRLIHAPASYAATPGGWHPVPGQPSCEEVAGGATIDLLKAAFSTFLRTIEHGHPPLCDLAEGAVELAALTEAIETALARAPRPVIPVSRIMEATP
jgi:predicted dehydrogenase